jgi:hypothetical protein
MEAKVTRLIYFCIYPVFGSSDFDSQPDYLDWGFSCFFSVCLENCCGRAFIFSPIHHWHPSSIALVYIVSAVEQSV